MSETCRNGHPRTPENTYIRPDDGSRVCRPCVRARQRRYERSPKGRAYVTAWQREKHHRLTGRQFAKRSLQMRRVNALRRMAERHRQEA